MEVVEERAGCGRVVQRIDCLDADEEAVARGPFERLDVEQRMVQPGQSAQSDQAKEPAEGSRQHHPLEGDGDERRPTQVWPATDVQRIPVGIQVVLHEEAGAGSGESAEEHHRAHFGLREIHGVGRVPNGVRAVAIEPGVAGGRGFLGGRDHFVGRSPNSASRP